MVGTVVGWSVRKNYGSDKPDYETDLLTCRHCGKVVFMCDSFTKKPLPASAVAERCNVCDKHICGKCKIKMNSGEICAYFRDKIDQEEASFAHSLRIGKYV
jgi:hypothetical protein